MKVELSTAEQLSAKIHKSIGSIYQDLRRNPESLPPTVKIPGSRKVLFYNVDQWLNSFINPAQDLNRTPTNTKRPGRPSKSEQVAQTSLKDRRPNR